MQLIPAAHGGKRPQWQANQPQPIAHGIISRLSRDGLRSLVGTDDHGVWIDREDHHVIGLEVEVKR